MLSFFISALKNLLSAFTSFFLLYLIFYITHLSLITNPPELQIPGILFTYLYC